MKVNIALGLRNLGELALPYVSSQRLLGSKWKRCLQAMREGSLRMTSSSMFHEEHQVTIRLKDTGWWRMNLVRLDKQGPTGLTGLESDTSDCGISGYLSMRTLIRKPVLVWQKRRKSTSASRILSVYRAGRADCGSDKSLHYLVVPR